MIANSLFWNLIKKDDETTVKARFGDVVWTTGGIVFLLKDGEIICKRWRKSRKSAKRSMLDFCNYLLSLGIIFVKFECKTNRYNWVKRQCNVYRIVQLTPDREMYYICLLDNLKIIKEK